VHQLFVEHQPEDYRRVDRRLRVVGLVGVGVGLGVALAASAAGSLAFQIVGVAIAVVTLGVALFLASRRYKRAYRQFIEDHMADDGTFLYCPNCKYDLSTQNQHRLCPKCQTKPWVFKQTP
jgi:uncharacterized paraquat-inducible protein A